MPQLTENNQYGLMKGKGRFGLSLYTACFAVITALAISGCGDDNGTGPNDNGEAAYTLTVNAGAGGTATGGGKFAEGADAPIFATPDSGCTFGSWSGQGIADSSSAATTMSVTSHTTVTANFSCLHTLTINASPASCAAALTSGDLYTTGTIVPISVTPALDCRFSGWTGATGIIDASSANASVLMDEDKTVTAIFIIFDTFTDSRDTTVYRTVTIGAQTWMAENLNYTIPNISNNRAIVDRCYNNSPDSCAKYGRLYTWAAVMGGAASSSANPSGVRGVCPAGWHVPSDDEWADLINFVGSPSGPKLRATSGWNHRGNGSDDFGFSALPGGYSYFPSYFNDFNTSNIFFFHAANSTGWWSSTENGTSHAWYRYMDYSYTNISRFAHGKTHMFSVRCVRS